MPTLADDTSLEVSLPGALHPCQRCHLLSLCHVLVVLGLCLSPLPPAPPSVVLAWGGTLALGSAAGSGFVEARIQFPGLVGGCPRHPPSIGALGRRLLSAGIQKASAVGEQGPEGRTVLYELCHLCVRDSCHIMFSYFSFIYGENYVLCGISMLWFSQREWGLCP